MTAPVGDDLTWLDDLQRAHAAATPGRWMADSHEIYQEWPGIPGMSGEWIGETCRVEGDPLHATSDADAALIVAAVNAVPTLIAELRKRDAALRAVLAYADELDGWRENALRYAEHSAPNPVSDAAARARALAYQRAVDGIRSTLTAALTPESVTT